MSEEMNMMATITTERLTKILSETQAVINEHNSRCVSGSVEVNARLFENVLMEVLHHRVAQIGKNLPQEATEEMEQAAFEAAGSPSNWHGFNEMWKAAVAIYHKSGDKQ